jgi:hypothetical protein
MKEGSSVRGQAHEQMGYGDVGFLLGNSWLRAQVSLVVPGLGQRESSGYFRNEIFIRSC